MRITIKTLGLSMLAALALLALGASAAQANLANFKVWESLPATVTVDSVGTQTFTTSEGTTLTCEEAPGVPAIEGSTMAEEAEAASLTVAVSAWNNCHATILKIPVTIEQNGCEFEFHAGKLVSDPAGTTASTGHTATGSLSIVNCDGETEGITITVGEGGKTCHIDVPEQNQGTGSVHYHTLTGGGGNEYVEATATNVVLDIDTTGGTACSGGTENPVATFATYNGNHVATAIGRSVTIN